jgi:hypothetical protein
LQAVVGDDPLDAADADLAVALPQLLGDHLGGSLGIQEEMAEHLADRLVGAAVGVFGASFLGLERRQAAGQEGLTELIISLPAIAEAGGDGGDVLVETLSLDEHEEAGGAEVGWADGQRASGADQAMRLGIELKVGVHLGRLMDEGVTV